MLRPICSFLIIGSLLMAADEPEYKSQLEVNLGTWDLAYSRHITDRFSLRLKAGWQDDRTTADLTSKEWYESNPDSLNPVTESTRNQDVNEQNLTLELAGLVPIIKTNHVHLVAGAGYRVGRGNSATITHTIASIPYFGNAILTTTRDYYHETQTTYHGPVGMIQLRHQMKPRLRFFAELIYRLEWRRSQSESITEEMSDYQYYNRTEWDKTETIQGFEKLKVGLSFQF
ncbi:MAG: hypothetical protein K9N34_04400 [Candidatus Marinimicrobia bacterium]|nr:hypothetical protein [Candidatus Neomarinimicrobiota bacterium]MCF7902587.1 hypothetical protein [Candidatus Neomarinimicrobiota bacterium]